MLRRRGAIALLLGTLGMTACDEFSTEPDSSLFVVTIENVSTVHDFFMTGTFDTPTGAANPGPAGPGAAYEFEFAAPPGARLSFASMFGQSNDLFYAPDGDGIALFTNGVPISGDVTAQVEIWDAGTEQNQEPGTGSNQAPRQPAPDTGPADPNPQVRLAEDEFNNLPAVEAVMQATLTSLGGNRFRLRLENVGSATVLQTSAGGMPAPFSPGVWVLHMGTSPLFTAGQADRGEGLEWIAEQGNPATLAMSLIGNAGVVTPLSPGVAAIHRARGALFRAGSLDRGEGLERIAEQGDPTDLAASLATSAAVSQVMVFATPAGQSAAGPAIPGTRYEFTVEASPGDRLSFATMFGQSNDLFYAPDDDGIALFMGNTPRSGDVSSEVSLWDVGTEVNETPGAGPNQAPRQSTPDMGTVESRPIAAPSDGYVYPATPDVVRVTITPQ